MSGTERPARIELMDALRGLAVCLMVLHHFLYDLCAFLGAPWWLFTNPVFDVLHLLASCMLLFGLTRGFWEALPAWVLPVLCLALIFLTAPCADGVTTQTPHLWLFGFTTPDFASADYFPLLPWFFVFLLGTWAGRYVKAGRLPQWFYTAKAPRLALVGRHALLLYVLHQPLLYALTMLLRLIFIR